VYGGATLSSRHHTPAWERLKSAPHPTQARQKNKIKENKNFLIFILFYFIFLSGLRWGVRFFLGGWRGGWGGVGGGRAEIKNIPLPTK
jgi:hypothetical protein